MENLIELLKKIITNVLTALSAVLVCSYSDCISVVFLSLCL